MRKEVAQVTPGSTIGKRTRPSGKRSFYAQVAADKERKALERARRVEGFDEEIALARTKTRIAAEKIPQDPNLVFRGLDTIARLQRARRQTAAGSEATAVPDAVRDILGIFSQPALRY